MFHGRCGMGSEYTSRVIGERACFERRLRWGRQFAPSFANMPVFCSLFYIFVSILCRNMELFFHMHSNFKNWRARDVCFMWRSCRLVLGRLLIPVSLVVCFGYNYYDHKRLVLRSLSQPQLITRLDHALLSCLTPHIYYLINTSLQVKLYPLSGGLFLTYGDLRWFLTQAMEKLVMHDLYNMNLRAISEVVWVRIFWIFSFFWEFTTVMHSGLVLW